MTGTLFVVGTPIGNLEDLTDRARRTLGAVRLVAAEDTRRTGALLTRLGIDVPMLSVFDANEASRAPRILEVLRRGDDVALVSDGGMPLVSDPGYRVVRAAAAAKIDVRVVPGPSAAVAALVVSGLPTDRWVFEGFLPRTRGDRRRRIDALRRETRTVVLFESPKRVGHLLEELASGLGDRRAALCRELTKLHEETIRGSLLELVAALEATPARGEVVVVVAGAVPERGDAAAALEAARALVDAGARPREAAREAAAAHDVSVNDLYARLVAR